MNCKPGDIAIIVTSHPKFNGRIVEVLFAPPSVRFNLPDGYPAVGRLTEPAWVIKAVGFPWTAELENGGKRSAWYGVGPDRALRPLRDDPDAVDADIKELERTE